MFKKILCAILIVSICIFPYVSFAETTDIYLSKTSTCYSEEKGLFFDDVKNTDPMGLPTRYCFSDGGTMSYNPSVTVKGNYAVYYYSTGDMSNNDQQEIVITSDLGEDKVTLNLKGNFGWKELGVYEFTPGNAAKVSFTRDRKGGALRSGALKLSKTDEDTFVAHSQEKKKILRDYPLGKGILITNSYTSDSYKYEEADGSFGDVAIGNCTGRTIRYTCSAGAEMRYRPTIGTSGEYYVLYWVTHNSSTTNTAMTVNIYNAGSTKNFTLDCTKQTGWVNLGKYSFSAGTDGYLETINGKNGEMLLSGGAYFVSSDDAEFDASIYATAEDPGMKIGASADELGNYFVSTKTKGYSESGRKDLFSVNGELLDSNKDYSRTIGGSSTSLCTAMNYTADIAVPGEYEIRYYVICTSKNATAQKIIINTSGKEKELIVNTQVPNGWISLGTYDLNGKTTVTTPSVGENGITHSGGVEFIANSSISGGDSFGNIDNGGFENNLTSWLTNGNGFDVTTTEVRSGDKALSFSWTDLQYTRLMKPIRVEKNKSYTVSFYMKNQGGQFAYYAINASTILAGEIWTRGSNSDWKQYTLTFNSADNDEICFVLKNVVLPTTAYFDDFTIAPSTAAGSKISILTSRAWGYAAAGNTLYAQADGIILNGDTLKDLQYSWQSSADGETWTDIPAETSDTYKIPDSGELKKYRAAITPIGIKNTGDTVYSQTVTENYETFAAAINKRINEKMAYAPGWFTNDTNTDYRNFILRLEKASAAYNTASKDNITSWNDYVNLISNLSRPESKEVLCSDSVTVNVDFNAPVKVSQITAGTFKLYKADDDANEISTCTYVPRNTFDCTLKDGSTVQLAQGMTINLKDGYAAKLYVLRRNVYGIKDVLNIEIPDTILVENKNVAITEDKAVVTATIKNANIEGTITPFVIVAAYDSTGKLIAAPVSKLQLTLENNSAQISKTFTSKNINSITMFVWNENMVPYILEKIKLK